MKTMEAFRTHEMQVSAGRGMQRWTQFLGCVLLCLVVGCTASETSGTAETGTEEDHHHHDHGHRPKSYQAALAEIKHARDDVKAAFDAGTPDARDDALHVVSEVLEVLPEVAAETDLPKEDWQVVKEKSKVLFDQFMKIHDGFHGGNAQGVTFDTVADEINAAIAVLESKVAATGEKIEAAHEHHDHDHDGHDHDHGDHEHGDHEHEEHDHEDHDHDH